MERLVEAGCEGILLELHLNTDDSRHSITIQKRCQKLNLQCWLMPVVGAPSSLHQAWMLEIGNGAPVPASRSGFLNALEESSADYLFAQLQKYLHGAPDGIFLPSFFAPSHEPFPWTPHFEKYFLEQHGYLFQEKRHSLTSTTGPDDARVRQHYWETVNAQIAKFLERCNELCHKEKCFFRHNFMEPELAAMPLPFQVTKRRRATHSVEIIPFNDWPALLANTFDCYMNDVLHLAVGLPIDFAIEPAKQYFQITKNARKLFADGKSAARVGMLFPLRSARTHYHPDTHRYPRWVGEDFGKMHDYLNTMHYEYRLVEEGELQNPPCELLIIPSTTALATESWSAIESWINRGGKVACTGLLPRWSERGRDAELEERVSRATKQTLQDVYDGYLAWERGTALPPHIGYPIFGEAHSGGRLCSYTPRLNHDAEDARLRLSQILRESLQSDFSSQNAAIIYHHQKSETTERFFLMNNSDQVQEVISRWIPAQDAAPGKIFQYDLDDNTMPPCAVWAPFPASQGGGVNLTLPFAPWQLRVFEIKFDEQQKHLWRANFEVEQITSDCIKGYASQSVHPFCVTEEDGKTIKWTAPRVFLPPPLWIDADVFEQDKNTFSGQLFVPADWDGYRVMLELRAGQAAAGLHVNAQNCGILIMSPFLFNISAAIHYGGLNLFQLHLWQNGEISLGPARLVAWPNVEIPLAEISLVRR